MITSFYFHDNNVSSSFIQIKVVASCGLSMYKTSSKSKFIFILKGLIGVRSINWPQVVINVSNLAFKMLSNNIGCIHLVSLIFSDATSKESSEPFSNSGRFYLLLLSNTVIIDFVFGNITMPCFLWFDFSCFMLQYF